VNQQVAHELLALQILTLLLETVRRVCRSVAPL
jgi:hypothetical protein